MILLLYLFVNNFKSIRGDIMCRQIYSPQRLELDRFVFLGRTWEEYLLIFNLKEEQLIGKRVLDCPGGACSFTAVANQKGIKAATVDAAYYYSIEELQKKGLDDIEYTLSKIEQVKDKCRWEYFEDTKDLRKERIKALIQCIEDIETNNGRYFPAVLPVLPFENDSFDITLSAHFLFMYADKIDCNFHLQTIKEMMRVTKEEIRMFPITDMNGKRYEHIDEIKEQISTKGWEVTESKVAYELHRNVNTMLKIRKKREY
jgi:hypothetical protein